MASDSAKLYMALDTALEILERRGLDLLVNDDPVYHSDPAPHEQARMQLELDKLVVTAQDVRARLVAKFANGDIIEEFCG